MNWAWATPLDQLWHPPAVPVWLTLVAAVFFAIVALIALLRAEKSVANGALTVITLLAVGIAVAATTMRGFGPEGRGAAAENRPFQPVSAALPALSCIDDLAGEAVLAACEKALFGSAEAAAAALSYAASQITRLSGFGDDAAANTSITPEMQALRRAVERDRYGLMAQALLVRDRCTPSECPAFRALTDSRQIVANMSERTYDGLIARYAPSWNAPAAAAAAAAVAALAPSMPTGKPTNAEFPSASSIPPVSIMTPEPGAATAPVPGVPGSSSIVANAPLPSPRPTATTPPPAALASAKKQPAPKPARAAAPVQLAPAAPALAVAPAPTGN